MATVGIIANPASGKDIRRLVSYGTVFNNQEKVNIVRRILLGLAAAKVKKVLYMPDYYGIVLKALDGLQSNDKLNLDIAPVDIELTSTQEDSFKAAQTMFNSNVGCIITLGGDGTNRLVAKGCGNVPILPVSTGTNNVFPVLVEGTIAGLAAGKVAGGISNHPQAVVPTKKLIVYKNEVPVDIALIDAVALKDTFIGARAIWEADRLMQAIITRGEPHNIGIASIAGNLIPISPEEKEGLELEFGEGGYCVTAPIAPGMIVPVSIKRYERIKIQQKVKVKYTPCVLALDGERELEVKKDDEVYIKLTFNGPRVIKVKAALKCSE